MIEIRVSCSPHPTPVHAQPNITRETIVLLIDLIKKIQYFLLFNLEQTLNSKINTLIAFPTQLELFKGLYTYTTECEIA